MVNQRCSVAVPNALRSHCAVSLYMLLQCGWHVRGMPPAPWQHPACQQVPPVLDRRQLCPLHGAGHLPAVRPWLADGSKPPVCEVVRCEQRNLIDGFGSYWCAGRLLAAPSRPSALIGHCPAIRPHSLLQCPRNCWCDEWGRCVRCRRSYGYTGPGSRRPCWACGPGGRCAACSEPGICHKCAHGWHLAGQRCVKPPRHHRWLL